MTYALLKELLTFLGVVITGAASIIGIVSDTKEEISGRLTAWGRKLIALSIFGVFLAGGSQIAAWFDSAESAREMLARYKQLLQKQQTSVLSGTRWSDLSVAVFFAPGTQLDNFTGKPFRCQLRLAVGSGAYLDVDARLNAADLNGGRDIDLVQAAGYVQLSDGAHLGSTRLKVADTAFSTTLPFANLAGPSFWVFLRIPELDARLSGSNNYKLWPFPQLGDLRGARLSIRPHGARRDQIAAVAIRINGHYEITLARNLDRSEFILSDVFAKLLELDTASH